jgi:uracil-DNA glycosylase
MTAPAFALRELQCALHRCERCAALVRCRSRVVPGHGPAPARVAFVGIAPGRLGGDRTGIPFSGDRSGVLLRAMIERGGLRRVFITNLVRCNPRDVGGRNRNPDASEIANCRDHLASELAIVRPRVIACLGKIVWRELAGRDADFDPALPAPRGFGRAMLFPMYHPAYVNRGAYPVAAYLRDFRRLARLVSAKPESVLS